MKIIHRKSVACGYFSFSLLIFLFFSSFCFPLLPPHYGVKCQKSPLDIPFFQRKNLVCCSPHLQTSPVRRKMAKVRVLLQEKAAPAAVGASKSRCTRTEKSLPTFGKKSCFSILFLYFCRRKNFSFSSPQGN